MDLYSRFNAKLSDAGIYKSLAEIGLALDDNLQATIKDSGKLDAALKDNFSSVQKLLDAVMAPLNTRLNALTGDKATRQLSKSNENLTKDITNLSICSINA
jgi:flagellar capping protein FliD